MSRFAALAAVMYEDDEEDDDDVEMMGQEGVVLFLRGRNGGYRRFGAGEMHAVGLESASTDDDEFDDDHAFARLH